MLTKEERFDLIHKIVEFEVEWANEDLDLKLATLDAVGADTIDEAIGPWCDNYDNLGDFDLEMIAASWKDFMGVLRHKAHELGLT